METFNRRRRHHLRCAYAYSIIAIRIAVKYFTKFKYKTTIYQKYNKIVLQNARSYNHIISRKTTDCTQRLSVNSTTKRVADLQLPDER